MIYQRENKRRRRKRRILKNIFKEKEVIDKNLVSKILSLSPPFFSFRLRHNLQRHDCHVYPHHHHHQHRNCDRNLLRGIFSRLFLVILLFKNHRNQHKSYFYSLCWLPRWLLNTSLFSPSFFSFDPLLFLMVNDYLIQIFRDIYFHPIHSSH